MFELTVLGTPRARLNTTTLLLRPRRLLVLAYLALEGATDRASLTSVFWEGLDTEVARSRLRLELHRIAHSPLGAFLTVDGETVQLAVDCDALRLMQAHAEGHWEQVAALDRGELLSGVAADTPTLQSWLETRREELTRQVTGALEQLAASAEQRGDDEAALTFERRLLDLDPYSQVYLQRALHRLRKLGQWQQERALSRQFRERFQRELGIVLPDEAAERPAPAGSGRPPSPPAAPPGLTDPPFVGRADLWSRLEAWEHSQARVALLTGEAGVGKSRLAAEWSQRHTGGVLVLRGVELAQGVPFYPLSEVLRRPEPTPLQNLAPAWQAELAALWPDLFPNTDSGPVSSSVRLLEALSEALRLCAQDAGLIVIEDLHWLDSSSFQVLDHALRRWGLLDSAPRLLMTARPGELAALPHLVSWLHDLERGGSLLRLTVTPLSEVSVLRLIRLLSGSPHATGFARRLHALSSGNPYALLAFLQGLQDQGLLSVNSDGPWTLNIGLDTLEQHLSPTLRETLYAALAHHGISVLRWMEAAALLAPPFDFRAAWAGSDLNEDTALSALDLAVTHRWIAPSEPGGYRFGHDLLRHALHHQLRPERAAAIHRRLARHLEQHPREVAQLAYHLEGAGERALAYPRWREAAASAGQHWAHREALGFLERALACTDDVQERLEAHRKRCFHHQALNDLKGWEDELDQINTLLNEQGEKLGAALEVERLAYISKRTHFLWRSNRLQEALDFSEPWVQGELIDDRIWLIHDRCVLLLETGDVIIAKQVLQDTLDKINTKNSIQAANLYNALAQAEHPDGNIITGLKYADQAIQIFGDLSIPGGIASAYCNQSFLYEAAGENKKQIASLEMAFSYAEKGSLVHLQASILNLLCESLIQMKNWALGLEYATKGLELNEEVIDEMNINVFKSWVTQFQTLRSSIYL